MAHKSLGMLNGYALNDEGEDLAVPLDKHWDLATLQSGKLDIKMYGMKISPPSAKIRFLMKYYKIPFKVVDGQGKPNSPYKKMPVLDIGDRQINDSYIIIKNLSRILQGEAFTPQQEQLEHLITFELMIALQKRCFNTSDIRKCGNLAGGGIGCFLGCCGSCIACCAKAPGADGKGGGPEPKPQLQTLEFYRAQFAIQLGHNDFFGGDAPDVTDVSLYGTLNPFATAGASCVDDFLGDVKTPLHAWHERMIVRTRDINVFNPYP